MNFQPVWNIILPWPRLIQSSSLHYVSLGYIIILFTELHLDYPFRYSTHNFMHISGLSLVCFMESKSYILSDIFFICKLLDKRWISLTWMNHYTKTLRTHFIISSHATWICRRKACSIFGVPVSRNSWRTQAHIRTRHCLRPAVLIMEKLHVVMDTGLTHNK
jgi:hypothetical protein